MSGQHQPEWDFYFCEMNDKTGSIMLDLGLSNVAPFSAWQHLLWISVKMNAPRAEDGLSSAEESEMLVQIEDELTAKLSGPHQAIYAGRLTYDGRRNFYFYLRDPLLHDRNVSEAMGAFPHYQFDYRLKEDKEWSAYFDFLYPEPEQMQSMYNRRVIHNLEKHGDALSKARKVDHHIYFLSESDRENFIGKILSEGFAVENKSEGESEAFPFGLHISRVDHVDAESVDAYTLYLVELAEACNGHYDGWGTHIEKE